MTRHYPGLRYFPTQWRGKQLINIPLPGDEGVVLDMLYERAVKRDDSFTDEEWDAYLCTYFQCRYECDRCISPRCTWCP